MNKTEESVYDNLNSVFHILNSDALLEQFPLDIVGSSIIMRECFIEGPLLAENFEAFVNTRSHYLAEVYPEVSTNFYEEQIVPEFHKIQTLPNASEVNLWFEDDVFCQTNFWFIIDLLKNKDITLYLVRPKDHTPYGFSGLRNEEFYEVYKARTALLEIASLQKLWRYYAHQDWEQLLQIATDLEKKYPFIKAAVVALMASIPNQKSLGRPKESLKLIAKELNTKEFVPIFKEFCKREAIYGYGDLQVRRMYQELLEKN